MRMTYSALLALALGASAAAMRRGDESLMRPRAHGTCARGPPQLLRWAVDQEEASHICCHNRHWAEGSGAYLRNELFMTEVRRGREITYYDSVTGKPLFAAPRGRTLEAFLEESARHGWPSFRDAEVLWEHVRVLSDGETVSVDGTHLGHNIPDAEGARYCINLCSVAGPPPARRLTQDEMRAALRERTG